MSKRKWLNLLISFSLSITALCQTNPQVTGKWKGVFQYNEDSTFREKLGDASEIYYTFYINGVFRSLEIRRQGKIKDTFQMNGRWQMVSMNTISVTNKNRIPRMPNEKYGDSQFKILYQTKAELRLYSKYSMDGSEGSYGTIVFTRIE